MNGSQRRELEVPADANLRKSLARGLQESAAGEVYDLGSFAELVCSGCGETYPANQIEGNLHDHWTAS